MVCPSELMCGTSLSDRPQYGAVFCVIEIQYVHRFTFLLLNIALKGDGFAEDAAVVAGRGGTNAKKEYRHQES